VTSHQDNAFTYASAGVDVDAGERAVALMRAAVSKAQRPETRGGLGGFAGLFDASALTGYRRPLLATSTDGVGTKIDVARRMDIHDTIGIDLVAMVVDDIVVCGAEPLFMTDYIACGRVVPERIAAIVTGVAEGCARAGVALLGGETAEHPGLLAEDEYDIAGAGTGVVEADELLSAERVRAGDVIIAMQSSGLHSNGYSLARRVLFEHAGRPLERHVDVLGRTLGEELLEPTRLYTRECLDVARSADIDVHVFCHVTGGGLAANLARVLPPALHAQIDRASWTPHAIFELIRGDGRIERLEMERTFNMGIGMLAVVAPESVDTALSRLAALGLDAWVCGEVRSRTDGDRSDAEPKGGTGGSVALVGDHTT
jgi:phosphoribosylformylglycinamidine cyclo-ligase